VADFRAKLFVDKGVLADDFATNGLASDRLRHDGAVLVVLGIAVED